MADPRLREQQMAMAQALRNPAADETEGMEIMHAPERLPEGLGPEELLKLFEKSMHKEWEEPPQPEMNLMAELDDLIGGGTSEAKAPPPRHSMPSNYIGPYRP